MDQVRPESEDRAATTMTPPFGRRLSQLAYAVDPSVATAALRSQRTESAGNAGSATDPVNPAEAPSTDSRPVVSPGADTGISHCTAGVPHPVRTRAAINHPARFPIGAA